MQDSTLLKIALITGLIGVFSLMIIMFSTEIQEVNISEAKAMEEDNIIKITGTIERITTKEDFTIINLRKEESITVVMFEKIDLNKGTKVEIEGKIQDYKGEKEIIAEKVTIK